MVEVAVSKKEKIVTLCDWHCPFEDKRVIELQLTFCKEEQPEIIILHELHDFYAVSRYDKDPERITCLQDEIDIVDRYLKRLREYCPKARIIMLNSNHLDRLRKYLWSQAQGLSSLRALNVERLLNLKDHRIEFKETFLYRGVLFKHGDIVRKFSGYSAKGEFEKEGTSGVTGHSHRLGLYFHRLRGGFYVWIESGCACKLDAEYIKGISNWQHGLSVVCFEKGSNKFYPTVIPIINNRMQWGQKTFIG